jgi:hypothetical protein
LGNSYIPIEGNMLFALTIFVVIVAAIAVAFAARSRRRTEYLTGDPPKALDASRFRPLFAPSDEDLLADEQEKQAVFDAQRVEEERLARQKKLAKFDEFRQTWRESIQRANTLELFRLAADLQSAESYLETVTAVLHERSTGRMADVSDRDLADIIESHFWLLPANERTPGVAFTIDREVAALRGNQF